MDDASSGELEREKGVLGKVVSCRGLNARRAEGDPALSARPDAATLGDSILSIVCEDPTTRNHIGMSDRDDL